MTLKESSDGETLMAVGTSYMYNYDSRFWEQQRRKHHVRNRFLSWEREGALVQERNVVNDWVDAIDGRI